MKVRVKGGWKLVSHSGKNLGTFKSLSALEKREREINYFKRKKGK